MIILPNIYYYLKSQWADLKAQKLIKGNKFIHKITDQDQTAKDTEKYKTNQVAQLYKKEDIYITIPYLPYRVKGLLTGTQQIILLWFISI